MTKKPNDGTRYIGGMMVPKSIGTGRMLMHNHVRHTLDMPCGDQRLSRLDCVQSNTRL
jgi:hypothetical protein